MEGARSRLPFFPTWRSPWALSSSALFALLRPSGTDLMGKGTMVGVACGFGAIFVSMIMEGGNPGSLLAPPALILILVGSFGAACAGVSLETAIDALKSAAVAFSAAPPDTAGVLTRLGHYAEVARRDGLLLLETKVGEEPQPLLRRGIQLAADGSDMDNARAILVKEAKAERKVWTDRADFYSKLGGYGPTLGILGTVLGLIHTLESLGGDPAELGHLIAAAFIATFFGVMFANLVFLPIGNKLKAIGAAEAELAMLIIDGITGLVAGKNPRTLLDELLSGLPPATRDELAESISARAA